MSMARELKMKHYVAYCLLMCIKKLAMSMNSLLQVAQSLLEKKAKA